MSVHWGAHVIAQDVDRQRLDLPVPEWLDADALLGPPDGRFARLVLHNGWNDSGWIDLDLGAVVEWGELVLVHRQAGPGNARSTSISVAGKDRQFRLLTRLPPPAELATTVVPIDSPVRYVRLGGGAGGGVGPDSTWFFDAVGVRAGAAAIGRIGAVRDEAAAVGERLNQAGDGGGTKTRLLEQAKSRLSRQVARLDGLSATPAGETPMVLQSVRDELSRIDAVVLRLAAGSLGRSSGGGPPDYVASWTSPMTKVRPDDPIRAKDLSFDGRIALARHEYEAIQLVLAAGEEDLRDVIVEIGPLERAAGRHVIPPVNVRIERLDHVIVNGEVWPDPILPVDSLSAPAGRQQSLWLRVYAPVGTPAGEYSATVHIRPAGLPAVALPLRLRVYDFDLPAITHAKHLIGCGAGGINEPAMRNRVPTGGGPCTGAIVEPRYILRKDGTIDIDFSGYDRVMERAFELGLTAFGLPLSAGDGGGLIPGRLRRPFHDEATGRNVELSMNPLEGELPRQRMIAWLRAFCDHLREKGWFDRACFYLWDEPQSPHLKDLSAIGRVVREAVPDLKILSVSGPGPQIDDVVDIYCPPVKWFGRPGLESLIAEMTGRGKELWWYNCGDPYPFPSYSIPRPAAAARMSFLLMWKYGITGNLYWATTVNGDLRTNKGTNVGADGRGDGQLLYIDARGRVCPSLRLEMIRDGVEDYEYLWMLRERIAQVREQGIDVGDAEGLLALPSGIAADASHYAIDPAAIYGYRERVAEAIERLGRADNAR